MVRSRSYYSIILLLLLATSAEAQRVELLDFYLPTCAPCRAMGPTIDRLASEGLPVRKIDGSRDVALAQRFRVNSYPTFIIMVDGVESGRVVGMTSHESLRTLLTQAGANRATTNPVADSRTFVPTTGSRNFTVGPDAGPGQQSFGQRSQTSAPSSLAPRDAQLIETSVRLTVVDDMGKSYGTGTIIDARAGEALVATCAHLFRDANGRPIETQGRLTIELFQQDSSGLRVIQRVPGTLVVQDFEADVALVRMSPQGTVPVARVASSPGSIVVGNPVRSVGCDLGADPSVRASRVVSLDRYHGPPNIETTGAPVQGRSGGGLFNEAGELIGICFAADNEADEGLYAGLASIHAQIDRIGLSELYRGTPAPQEPATLSLAQANPAPLSMPESTAVRPAATNPFDSDSRIPGQFAQAEPSGGRESQLQPVEPWPQAEPLFRAQDRVSPGMNPVERATLEEIVRRGSTSEVVLVIRSNEPGGKTEVMTLDSASPAMVEALRSLGAPNSGR